MIIGVPKEIKNNEYRVGLTPSSVRDLVSHGHTVLVETNAGQGINASDENYVLSGATIVQTPEEVFDSAELIVKVKEPQPNECKLLKPSHVLFTYLHLAADPTQADLLMESGCTAIAYETVTDYLGRLPLLAPMSEIAGRMSIQVGACALEKENSGSGILLGGIPGVAPGNVVILGGGVVGLNAAKMAIGLGANVTIIDKSLPRLREIDNMFHGRIKTLYNTAHSVEEQLIDADLIIGAALIPGATAPKLINRKDLSNMQPGSVLVDVSIDQGGCFETSRPTTHSAPTYIVDDIVHYCVANMPGAVPKTSTYGLNNATLPFVLQMANCGWKVACGLDINLHRGVNIHNHVIVHRGVADSLNKQCHTLD